jgi:tetratricopeptide (TPR) repeat protein
MNSSEKRTRTWACCAALLTVVCTLMVQPIPVMAAADVSPQGADAPGVYSGSSSCRQCHEKFYQLWAPSHHGLAMQPYTTDFAKAQLTPQDDPVKIGAFSYSAKLDKQKGFVLEQGPDGEKQYPILHVLGGKNVFYFLASYKRGRLQTLPVAYNVNTKRWFDTAGSGVRHFPGRERDEAVHWTDPLYTFNTSCYGCHVSQLSSNYDLKTDSYNTQWAEPGINCETCHGPADEHVKLYQQAAKDGQKPATLGLISTKPFSPEQMNSMCNSCHAKMSTISAAFKPGDRYFDHYDLITLENPDFYPDGRDLGENYTMTSWRMSPCVKNGKMDCMHCHTSSGRYRFSEPDEANGACLPCHKARVDNWEGHSHHKPGKDAPQCISCHMPMTQFAHMNRTDHSMRPPVPAATLKYKSPNACNLCHEDKDAAWAQKQVTEWDLDTRQGAYLQLAEHVDQAQRGNWKQLDRILAYVQDKDRDEIIAGSLLRLLRTCDSPKKWPVLIRTLENDASPFVRTAAAETLDGNTTDSAVKALLKATTDAYRLVRVRAASSLARVPREGLETSQRKDLAQATAELTEGLHARPDDYAAHFNLGNFYMAQRKLSPSIAAYQTAIKLRPDYLASHVNIAFVHNALGQNAQAEKSFYQALALDPNSLIAQTNLAMLLGEMGRMGAAEKAFRRVMVLDPNSATAAFNLGVILAEKQPRQALQWAKKAYELNPQEPKYAYTYAFYLRAQGDTTRAMQVLQRVVDRKLAYPDAYMLLGNIHETQGIPWEARRVYEQAARLSGLTQQERMFFEMQARRLGGR